MSSTHCVLTDPTITCITTGILALYNIATHLQNTTTSLKAVLHIIYIQTVYLITVYINQSKIIFTKITIASYVYIIHVNCII